MSEPDRKKQGRAEADLEASAEAPPGASMDEVFPDRPHLRNSRQLSWDRAASSPAAQAVVTALLVELEGMEDRRRARQAEHRRGLQSVLEAITLDLFVAAGDDPDMFVAYSRRAEDYTTAKRRYVHPDATPTRVCDVAEFLEAAGYAEATRGSYQRGAFGGTGYRSRLKATDKLVRFFAERGVGLADIGVREDAELIRLKGPPATRGGPKPLIGYAETPDVTKMRDRLRAWADVAARHRILPGAGRLDRGARRAADEDAGAGEQVELHRARLYRVFNNGSWEAGGRFYGGWWLTMSAADRANITIDGEPTVELDFKALHPRLVYHLQGRPLPLDDDPYDLGERVIGVERDVVKVAFNQLLAVGPGVAIRPPAGVELPRGVRYAQVLRALEDKHAPIRTWLRSARALELQRIDSRIAEMVMSYFTGSLQRPILPVHDSFRVAQRDEYKLGETMFLAYEATLKTLTNVAAYPVVKGWTECAGVEARVMAAMATADADL